MLAGISAKMLTNWQRCPIGTAFVRIPGVTDGHGPKGTRRREPGRERTGGDDEDENYKQLKIDVSSLDAKIQMMIEDAEDKRIVVTNNLFKYLEKYGLTVYSLDEKNPDVNAIYRQAVNLINNGTIK